MDTNCCWAWGSFELNVVIVCVVCLSIIFFLSSDFYSNISENEGVKLVKFIKRKLKMCEHDYKTIKEYTLDSPIAAAIKQGRSVKACGFVDASSDHIKLMKCEKCGRRKKKVTTTSF